MARRLKLKRVNRVDLVDEGANFDKKTGEGSHIMLWKSLVDIEKRIVERDGEYCVVSEDGSKTLGCHDTKDKAMEQLRAVEANKRADDETGPIKAAFATLAKALGFAKADEQAPPDEGMTFNEALMHRRMHVVAQEVWDYLGSLGDAIMTTLQGEATDKLVRIEAAVGQFGKAMSECLKRLSTDYDEEDVEKAGRKISAERLGRLKKAADTLAAIIKEAEMPEEKKPETVVTKAAGETKEPEMVPAAKVIEVEKALVALQKQVEQEREARLKAEEAVKKSEQAKVLENQVAFIKSLDRLPIKADEMAQPLANLAATDAALYGQVTSALKAANEHAKLGKAMETVGSDRQPVAGSAVETVVKLASEKIAKSDKSKKVAMADAISEVLSEHPELYEEYVKATQVKV